MRIGFDVDGVLANFIPAYQALTVKVAGGNNLFLPGDDINPPSWDWPEYRGYSSDTMRQVWDEIETSCEFWVTLGECPGCATLRDAIDALNMLACDDLYFITSRVGRTAKHQTEVWLQDHLGIRLPTVLISSEKGLCAKALRLDAYIDDNLDYVKDVCKTSPSTYVCLLDRAYNQDPHNPTNHRVTSLDGFLNRVVVD